MFGSIPNPKKSIPVEFAMGKVKEAVLAIPALNPKYKSSSTNDILNLFTFEAFEFLSLGVYIDVSLNKLTDDKTEITVEIRRKVGSFDQSHEVTQANKHIQRIFELISTALTMSADRLHEIKTAPAAKPQRGCLGITLLILFISCLAAAALAI